MKITIVAIIESIIVITEFIIVIIKPSLRGFEKAVAIHNFYYIKAKPIIIQYTKINKSRQIN